MTKLPARIRRMSKRRAKVAAVKWVAAKVRASLQGLVGRKCDGLLVHDVIERTDEVFRALLPPPPVITNLKAEIDGDKMLVTFDMPAPPGGWRIAEC